MNNEARRAALETAVRGVLNPLEFDRPDAILQVS